jgi:nucleoside-triphosphatase THEP1
MPVFIITGVQDSGKTTYCERDLLVQPGTPRSGVLLKKVFRGGECIGYDAVRIGVDQKAAFTRRFDREPEGWDAVERVGPYTVSGSGKHAANGWIRNAFSSGSGGLIIDEVGPLETAGGGLAVSVAYTLSHITPERELFLVVRCSWLDIVVRCFAIREYRQICIPPGHGSCPGC